MNESVNLYCNLNKPVITLTHTHTYSIKASQLKKDGRLFWSYFLSNPEFLYIQLTVNKGFLSHGAWYQASSLHARHVTKIQMQFVYDLSALVGPPVVHCSTGDFPDVTVQLWKTDSLLIYSQWRKAGAAGGILP